MSDLLARTSFVLTKSCNAVKGFYALGDLNSSLEYLGVKCGRNKESEDAQ